MKTDDVYIAQSRIEGRGVFASRAFKKGELVIRWDTSDKIPLEDIPNLSQEQKLHTCLLDEVCIITKPPESLVNHSCDPNTFEKDFCEFAARDIKKDEEITADYSRQTPGGISMTCNCRAGKCKKIVKF